MTLLNICLIILLMFFINHNIKLNQLINRWNFIIFFSLILIKYLFQYEQWSIISDEKKSQRKY